METKLVKLKTVSPLHIGSREREITPFDFVTLGGKLYVINVDKFAVELKKRNLISAYVTAVKTSGSRFRIIDFLQSNKLNNESFLDSVSTYSCLCNLLPKKLRPFIRDAFGRPFIPGSAIKGAIRTAILFSLVKTNEKELGDFVKSQLQCYNDNQPRRDFFMKHFSDRLIEDYYQYFNLPNEKEANPRTDILRCLKVSDSVPLDKNSLKVIEAKVLSIRIREKDKTNEGYTKDFSFYLEVIPPETELQFSIKLDPIILNDFRKYNSDISLPFSTVDDIFTLCQEFAQFVAEKEIEYLQQNDTRTSNHLKKFYNEKKNSLNFRLGWGSGLLGTTVDGLLPQPLFKKLRDTFWKQRNEPLVPKTRRVTVMNNQLDLPFGWVEISL